MGITTVKFADIIVKNIGLLAGENDPQLKLRPVGFLKMLLDNPATVNIRNIDALREGTDRQIKVRFLPRGLESQVGTADNCDTADNTNYGTTEITHNLFRKIGIFISDTEMRKYEDEAQQSIQLGESQQTALMRPLFEAMLSQMVGLIGSIDSSLVAAMATQFGGNAAYAGTPTAAQTIAFGESASMSDGYVKLVEDAMVNEVSGDLLVVGNGVINRYDIFNRVKTTGDYKGVGALPVNAYYDPRTITAWGANYFGAFAKGAVGFVPWNKYVKAYAGEKGKSVFFTIPVPTEIDGKLSVITFDAQLFYDDCPQYSDSGELLRDRGWNLIISLHYGLYVQPTTAFQEGDPLAGVNGTFQYVATEKKGIEVTPADGAVFNTKEVTDPEPSAQAAGEDAGDNAGEGAGA